VHTLFYLNDVLKHFHIHNKNNPECIWWCINKTKKQANDTSWAKYVYQKILNTMYSKYLGT